MWFLVQKCFNSLFLSLYTAENTKEYNTQHNKRNDNIKLVFSMVNPINEKRHEIQV